MRFYAADKAQSKKIVAGLWASAAQGKVRIETVRKVYIHRSAFSARRARRTAASMAGALRPSSRASAAVVAAFIFCAVVALTLCSLQGEKRRLQVDKQQLILQNLQLHSDVSHLNDTVHNVNSLNQAQDDLIAEQQESLAWIEKGLNNIEAQHQADVNTVAEEKEATIQQLLDMIENLDIFSTVSRSGAFTSAVSQIEQAKYTILDALGDTPEAESLLQKLDSEAARIQDYADHYPNYFPTSGSLSSPYGWRRDPITGAASAFHSGMDLANSIGTPVYAAASGTVILASEVSGYGKCILIDHGNGYQTRYGHLSEYLVSVGDTVHKADKIALMGNTGRVTGPHLHFEVILNGQTQDPKDYIG